MAIGSGHTCKQNTEIDWKYQACGWFVSYVFFKYFPLKIDLWHRLLKNIFYLQSTPWGILEKPATSSTRRWSTETEETIDPRVTTMKPASPKLEIHNWRSWGIKWVGVWAIEEICRVLSKAGWERDVCSYRGVKIRWEVGVRKVQRGKEVNLKT